MRLKLYCNRYAHFKDPLVCAVNCVYRTRCGDFALFYDQHRDETEKIVAAYLNARQMKSAPLQSSVAPSPTNAQGFFQLEVLRVMTDATYIWIGNDDQAELLEIAEVLQRAEQGIQAKHIYKVAQEMELRFQLVPRKGIERAKRVASADAAVNAERAAARRSRLRPVTDDAMAQERVTGQSFAEVPAEDQSPSLAVPRRARAAKS